MKVKPVEMGLQMTGDPRETPQMLRRAASYALDFGYVVKSVRVSTDLDSAYEAYETKMVVAFEEPPTIH